MHHGGGGVLTMSILLLCTKIALRRGAPLRSMHSVFYSYWFSMASLFRGFLHCCLFFGWLRGQLHASLLFGVQEFTLCWGSSRRRAERVMSQRVSMTCFVRISIWFLPSYRQKPTDRTCVSDCSCVVTSHMLQCKATTAGSD